MTDTDKKLARVTSDLTRTDAKAGALLSGGGILAAAFGLIIASGHAEPISAALAAILLAASLIASVLVIRPHIKDDDAASFPYLAKLDPNDHEQFDAAVATDNSRAQLVFLSGLVFRKMTRLRWATDLTVAAVPAILLSAVIAAVR